MRIINPGDTARNAIASTNAAPDSPPTPVQSCPLHWIEVQLVDQDNEPIPGARYSIVTPDDVLHEGQLDSYGFVRIDNIPAGSSTVSFPDYDRRGVSRR
jgi:hypothetical protein